MNLDIYDKQKIIINSINYFKLNTRLGQLKQKLNLELIFFMNLKTLRLNYTMNLENIKKQNRIIIMKPTSLKIANKIQIDNESSSSSSKQIKIECLNCMKNKLKNSSDTLLSSSETNNKAFRSRRLLKSKK